MTTSAFLIEESCCHYVIAPEALGTVAPLEIAGMAVDHAREVVFERLEVVCREISRVFGGVIAGSSPCNDSDLDRTSLSVVGVPVAFDPDLDHLRRITAGVVSSVQSRGLMSFLG